MQDRVVEFVAALRAAGVRISIAESLDALRAIEQAGVTERELFRAALQTTLVKERRDQAAFARLFPVYFGGSGGAFAQIDDGAALSPSALAQLRRALEDVAGRAARPTLALLFRAMVEGRPLSQAQLAALLAEAGSIGTSNPTFQPWMARRVLRELQVEQLGQLLHELLEQLRAEGVGEGDLGAIAELAQANQAALAEQISQAVARQMARQSVGEGPPKHTGEELLDRAFHLLTADEVEELRGAVARLAAQLRTRAALRRRQARRGRLDPRGTLRASLRYDGVPVTLRRRRRRLRPRLVVLCDVSNSMRAVAAFMLMLVYALHDQISRTRSFAYIDELHDISAAFADARPAEAVAAVLGRIRADYARTDLGSCLEHFTREHMGSVDRRTTVIILGDGRNNRADPGLEHVRLLRRRARRLLWFTPESRRDWGIGDSDMLAYEPLCDSVHVVRTLRQLSAAVEALLDELPAS